MSFLNFNLPNITNGSLDDAKERKQIKEYLFKLTEQLKYTLGNLDEDNFSSAYQQTVMAATSNASRTEALKDDVTFLKESVKTLEERVDKVRFGTCVLNGTEETETVFEDALLNAPTAVLLTPFTKTGGNVSAKVTEVTETGFKAILSDAALSQEIFMYLAI